ncbi:MAG TPA: OmcA/MtrC family decaheme c-type cytochrome [Bryobacteraceae bacterium]|nr:OmcA/MtrC family decaheme c-type cytochrome [Bryobacteraceae bacterium]
MRTSSSALAIRRYILVVLVVAASVLLLSGADKARLTPQERFDAHDPAAYASNAMIQYVNPGLVFTVTSANISSSGVISVTYTTTDPTGLPLDTAGVQTPGKISASLICAYIPKGQSQYVSYVTRTATAVTGGATATQASADSGGTTATVAVGTYTYTFKTTAPSGFDPTATHRIGIYGSRNLTTWNLGTNYASTTYDFVPAGGTPAPRDIVRTADCNTCHYQLAFHGGSRRGVDLCIMCHTPQTVDPNTGNTLDMPVLAHQIHIGSSFPTIQSTTPYSIVGFGNAVDSWTGVVYPPDVRNCAKTCHNPKNGAAQTNRWEMHPDRAACGGCHSNINFATGQNHVNLPEIDDTQCAGCHIPQGELDFDASIVGAHVIPQYSTSVPGINITLNQVTNGVAGQKPTVTFTATNNAGQPVTMTYLKANSGSLSLTMTGPTTDYGNVSFGSDLTSTPGYVTESATGATCSSAGVCTYTFTHGIPANATGTYTIGVEARLSTTLLPGTTAATAATYSAHNSVINFSVDGSKVAPRRTVVLEANCNHCHTDLEVHGSLRNDVTYCPVCHNPNNTDYTTRPTAPAPYPSQPPQAINFALMVHKIHSGVNMAQYNATYVVVGHGGSVNDFSGTLYPAMSPTGGVSDTTICEMCHAAGTENNDPIGKLAVTDPQGLENPTPATTSACTACHLDTATYAHASSNTDPKFGESCSVCHGASGAYSASSVHAGL